MESHAEAIQRILLNERKSQLKMNPIRLMCPRCDRQMSLREDHCTCGFDRKRQVAVIVNSGMPGAHYGEPRARLEDGRTIPMGWSAGRTYSVGTTGVAEYIRTGHASLWKFTPDPDDNPTGNQPAAA